MLLQQEMVDLRQVVQAAGRVAAEAHGAGAGALDGVVAAAVVAEEAAAVQRDNHAGLDQPGGWEEALRLAADL